MKMIKNNENYKHSSTTTLFNQSDIDNIGK